MSKTYLCGHCGNSAFTIYAESVVCFHCRVSAIEIKSDDMDFLIENKIIKVRE